jgi:hypothetical protein
MNYGKVNDLPNYISVVHLKYAPTQNYLLL